MQYVSGVWHSLTGQSVVKRKRSDDEEATLPDRMTSMKLHADQNPGGHHCALSSDGSYDHHSSAASGSHFHATHSSSLRCHSNLTQGSKVSFLLVSHAQSSRFPSTASWTHAVPQQSTTGTASFSTTVSFQQGSTSIHSLPPSLARHSSLDLPSESSQFTDLVHKQLVPRQASSNAQQHANNCQQQPVDTLTAPSTDADLLCSEAFSPITWHDIPFQPSLYSPGMALSESVADSPDDMIELLEDEVTQPDSPFAKQNAAAALLAVCQSPLVINALSKLHACKELPSGCVMLPLPLAAQHCGIAMARELSSAASAQARWQTASQLDWTIAAMFALSQRAKLCEQELDAVMLLSILWILECCSSQVNSTVPVVTSRYLDYICNKAAAAGPNSSSQIRIWQSDLKADQMEVLTRCNWRVHLAFDTDLTSALQQLQQFDNNIQMQSIVSNVQAGSKRRDELKKQMQARAAQHVLQSQQALEHRQQKQQVYEAACCQSSTKPARPSSKQVHHETHATASHSRLRQQSEEAIDSSLNGKY